jgi:2-methylcitrate dehydratase PrpD
VSVQHAVAAALVTGKAGLDQFSDACVRDRAVLALRRKVEVIRDPAIATVAAAVELWTSDGTKYASRHRPRAEARQIRCAMKRSKTSCARSPPDGDPATTPRR